MPDGTDGPSAQERLPDPGNILVEMTLVPRVGAAVRSAATAAGPAPAAGPHFRILRTLEVDEYERPIEPAQILALAALHPAPSDNRFHGTARKDAKLSIAAAPTESFDDVNDLIASFVDHDTMEEMDIPTTANSDRVDEEKRNVRVKAFLYAASREDDNDYHLIIGRAPDKPPKYMTAEISGLPPNGSASFARLDAARKAYFEYFGDGLPSTSYEYYDPPREVEIEGSLFWDANHANGGRPGPQKLRPHMPVVWEIHPVTKIVFEP